MPTYTLFNEQAGVEYEDFLTIAEYEQLLKDSPFIKRVWDNAPAIVGDHMMGVGPKVDGGFNENMSRIAEAHPGSPMSDRYGKSSTKDSKTRDILKKHGAI
tara:strand:+ start:294 stop:596 length:303 start_codon:yes stop_codon:yes gene_type:complete